jgi:CheY-like chemotaxis protein
MAKILLIDDEPDLQFMYAKVLESYGLETIIATSAANGLAQAKQAKPDLIILDLVMKPLDGFAVFEQLKSQVETREIPVVILTNLTRDNLYDELMDKGAVAFLEKTDYSPHEVADRIMSLIAKP